MLHFCIIILQLLQEKVTHLVILRLVQSTLLSTVLLHLGALMKRQIKSISMKLSPTFQPKQEVRLLMFLLLFSTSRSIRTFLGLVSILCITMQSKRLFMHWPVFIYICAIILTDLFVFLNHLIHLTCTFLLTKY